MISFWAILPEYFDDHIYFDATKQTARDLNMVISTGEATPRLEDGVLIVPVKGAISKNDYDSFFYSSVSTNKIKEIIQKAIESEQVNGIILDIDSPGGTVDGTFELVDYIKEAKTQKPIYAFSDGMIASAAYAIASATSGIFVNNPGTTNPIGSIGVISKKLDSTEYHKRNGIIVSEFVSGRYKNLGSEHKIHSDEDVNMMQDRVNKLYQVFVDAVDSARAGKITRQTIIGLEGATVLGRDALQLGLIDGVCSLNDLIFKINEGVNLEAKEQQDFFIKGQNSERERVNFILTYCKGMEFDSIKEMINSDIKKEDVFSKVLSFHEERMEKEKKGLLLSSTAPVSYSDIPEETQSAKVLSDDEKLEKEWESDEQLKSEFFSFDSYKSYCKAFNSGRVKGA